MPKKLPIMTAWAPLHGAEPLSGQSREFVVERSLQTLSGITAVSMPKLQSLLADAYLHGWQIDPFSLGALEKFSRMGSSQRSGNPCRTRCSLRERLPTQPDTSEPCTERSRVWVSRGPADSAAIGLSLTTGQRDENRADTAERVLGESAQPSDTYCAVFSTSRKRAALPLSPR